MKIFIIAGESSGDQLGFKLMRALTAQSAQAIEFHGVGGPAMLAEGLRPLFALEHIAVMGILPVLARLPALLARIRQTAAAAVAWRPDVLVLIDSPDFTHRVARAVRRRLPGLPVIDYVSPTVWAWRPGRAAAMRPIIDHVLALLPFEPEAHRRLGGPACTYVGHPLIERLAELRPNAAEAAHRAAGPPVLLALPGSRRSEVDRLMPAFGEALGLLVRRTGRFDVILPAVPHLEARIREHLRHWPLQPRLALGEAAKLAAFRSAHVALCASGTVTLELALSGVPMVVAYRVAAAEYWLRFLVTAKSIVLPNLILDESVIPEFIQHHAEPAALAAALAALIGDTPTRAAQLSALGRLDAVMRIGPGETPSGRAAHIVLSAAQGRYRLPIGT